MRKTQILRFHRFDLFDFYINWHNGELADALMIENNIFF